MNVICLTFPQPHIILSTYNNVALRSSISARQSVKMHARTRQLSRYSDQATFKSRQRLEIFLFSKWSRTAVGPTQPPNGCGAHPTPYSKATGRISFLKEGLSNRGREVDHSLPFSAKSLAIRHTSAPPYAFTTLSGANSITHLLTRTQINE